MLAQAVQAVLAREAVESATHVGFDPRSLEFARGVAKLVTGDARGARVEFETGRERVRRSGGFLELEMLQCIANAAAAMRADDAEQAFYDAVREHHDRRFWMYQWIVVENLAVYWADIGKLQAAATVLGRG